MYSQITSLHNVVRRTQLTQILNMLLVGNTTPYHTLPVIKLCNNDGSPFKNAIKMLNLCKSM